jgi:GntR family transcriptional regulator/MocR family aminotransferase
MDPVFPFNLTLDRTLAGSLAHHLRDQLRAAILEGRLAAGTPLPSTRRAAGALGLARNTVIAAYDLLVAEGYVQPRTTATPVVAELARRRTERHRSPARTLADPRIQPAWQAVRAPAAAAPDLPERCFRPGVPEYRGFPFELWRRLSARQLRAWSRQPFGHPPPEGLPALREAIARHVAFTRAVSCDSTQVLVTAGAAQAFDLLARLLVAPGRTAVAVEEPGYPPLRAAFAAAGAQLLPVPVDDEGLCVDRLPPQARVICVTPSHQFPTGAALSLRRRMALLAFARQHGAVVVEDDYDGEFRFGGRPLDALQTLDRDESVFYVGTFSKSLFPALRKGFVVAPAWAYAALVQVKRSADGHADALAQAVLADFIAQGHLARHVRRMQPLYAARRTVLLKALQRELAPWMTPIASEAGLHLSVRLQAGRMAPRIVEAARRCTPGAQPLADHAADPRRLAPGLCFGYGVMDAQDMPRALARLRRAIEAG